MNELNNARTFIEYVEKTEHLIRVAMPVIPAESYYRKWIMRRDTLSAERWLRLARRLRSSPYVAERASR